MSGMSSTSTRPFPTMGVFHMQPQAPCLCTIGWVVSLVFPNSQQRTIFPLA